MNDYHHGYETYRKACEKHDLEPINFRYYLLNLSQEQLHAYNESAERKRSHDEYASH